jgi:hypothetical protein
MVHKIKGKYLFTSDASHGWIKVPIEELKELGIADKITGYSYQTPDGKFAYLEEDADATTFVDAFQKRFNKEPEFKSKVVNYSRIRNLPHYKKVM